MNLALKVLQKSHRIARRHANRALWRLKAASLPKSPEGQLMLHIGCGLVDAPGYINIDARPMPHVHFIVHDLRDMNFVPPQTVDLVYMCHVLEHVSHRDMGDLLRSLHGITRPGGTLRISVPDFDLMLALYAASRNNMRAIIGPLMGGQDYPQNYHYTAFNAASLTALLEAHGYSQVRRWQADQVPHHAFTDWSNRDIDWEGQAYPVSLNLEATRV